MPLRLFGKSLCISFSNFILESTIQQLKQQQVYKQYGNSVPTYILDTFSGVRLFGSIFNLEKICCGAGFVASSSFPMSSMSVLLSFGVVRAPQSRVATNPRVKQTDSSCGILHKVTSSHQWGGRSASNQVTAGVQGSLSGSSLGQWWRKVGCCSTWCFAENRASQRLFKAASMKWMPKTSVISKDEC